VSDTPVTNADQAALWDGEEGAHWVRHQRRYEDLTGGFTAPLLDAAAVAEADRVLDIGCGSGQTTRLAAQQARQGRALGIDLSSAMLERGRADAADAGVTNVVFEQGDAQVHEFPARAFDVAISRFGVMFFDDPVAAFANVAAALVPGGRLAFMCWQDVPRNEWITVPAGAALAHVPMPDLGSPDSPGPFSLADAARIDQVLGAAGFSDVTTANVEAPMRPGDDADDAIAFFRDTELARTLLDQVDAETAELALDAMREALRSHEGPDGLWLGGAAWLVTAHRG
jgi:SAM-dependent methyltransferase